MGRRLRRLWHWFGTRGGVIVAAALVTLAVAVLVVTDSAGTDRTWTNLVVTLVVGGAVVVGLTALRGSTSSDDGRIAPAPWTPEGGIVQQAPERTRTDHDLSGDGLTGDIEHAGALARQRGTVAAGLAELRPTLQEALIDALVRGGTDPSEAERIVATGAWTDDRAAAATLSRGVDRPDWPLGERIRAWLFPERVVRREARRAVHEIGRAASESVPAVPGRSAPRTVPVVRPGLGELRRGAGGELQRAVDPLADPTRRAGVGDGPPRASGSTEEHGDRKTGNATGEGRS